MKVNERAGIKRLEIEYDRDLQRKLSAQSSFSPLSLAMATGRNALPDGVSSRPPGLEVVLVIEGGAERLKPGSALRNSKPQNAEAPQWPLRVHSWFKFIDSRGTANGCQGT